MTVRCPGCGRDISMSNIARHIEAKHPEYGYWLRELIDEPPHDGDRL